MNHKIAMDPLTVPVPFPGRAPLSVLLVDDEDLFRSSARRALREAIPHCVVECVADGSDALRRIAQEHFDVVVTDLHMPQVDGLTLLAELTQLEFDGRLVVLTAFPQNRFELDARSRGVVHFLEKPVSIKDLVVAVGGPSSGSVGRVRGLSLAGMSQLVESERVDVHLRVRLVEPPRSGAQTENGSTDNEAVRSGSLFFEGGCLVSAMADSLQGHEAALRLFALGNEQLQFELHPLTGVRQRTITKPLSYLLLEGARLADERTTARAASALNDGGTQDGDNRWLVPERNVIVARCASASGVLSPQSRPVRPIDEPRDLEGCFDPLLRLAGVLGAALVDVVDGSVLAYMEEPDGLDIRTSAELSVGLVRAHFATTHSGRSQELREVTTTFACEQHINLFLSGDQDLYVHCVLDRQSADVAAARQRLLAIGQSLQLASR